MATDIPVEQIETTVEAIQTFDAMGIKDELLRSIYSFGFEKPSAIQQRAIVPLIQGKNLIAQAQSGTGKTTALSIGTIQRIEVEKRICQAIILSPYSELALQTQEVIKNLSQHLGIEVFACIEELPEEKTIETKVGIYGSIQLDSLLKQITSENLFDINNNKRWKKVKTQKKF